MHVSRIILVENLAESVPFRRVREPEEGELGRFGRLGRRHRRSKRRVARWRGMMSVQLFVSVNSSGKPTLPGAFYPPPQRVSVH